MIGRGLLPPGAARHKRLLAALVIDALGSGLFIPFSLLFFVATTPLSLPTIGLALSVAALVRIPATFAAGGFSDRIGPQRAVVIAQVLQAVGFVNYLFVGTTWHLIVAAGMVQVGNSIFWVAYQALVSEVAGDGGREQWFALATAVRTAGWAVGGVVAGVVVAVGGRSGYVFVAAADAASFAVAAALMWGPLVGLGRERLEPAAAPEDGQTGWSSVLRDGPFLGFVGANLGLTLLSLAFAVGLPVFLVRTVGLPTWTPGAVLAINAVLGTLGTPLIVRRITGRSRRGVLLRSQTIIAAGFAAVLAIAFVPTAAGLVLAVVAVVLVTGCEVMQGSVVPAVVTEASTPRTLGRYMSAYQLTFAICDIITPSLVTLTLHHGAAALWLPLIAIALLDMPLLAVVARRLPPLRLPVGRVEPDLTRERMVETDSV
ncbi:MAG TPA: MFS transporter [Mycobacteriales bacterium]|jgi:MFS family permease